MKQTLFEAEAVLSINSAQFMSGVNAVVDQAQQKLKTLNNSVNLFGSGGGRGGGTGGGSGSSYADRMFSDNMKYAKLERSAGQYADALSRLNSMMANYKLTAMQMSQAEDLRDRIIVRQTANLGKLQKAQDKLDDRRNRVAGGGGTFIGGSDPVVNRMFKDEMGAAKLAAGTGNYAEAEARLTAVMNNQKISVTQLAQATATLAQVRARSGINPSGFVGPLMANGQMIGNTGAVSGGNPGGVQGPSMANGSFVSPYGGMSNPKGFVGPLLPNGGRVSNTGGGAAGGGMRTAQMSNASYALQDFMTVLSMGGGMQRALLSASNNIGFMASMTGTATGAFIGIGAVIASVAIPALTRWVGGVKDAAEGTESLTQALGRLSTATSGIRDRHGVAGRVADFQRQMSGTFTSGKNVSGKEQIADMERRISTEKKVLEEVRQATLRNRLNIGQRAVDNVGLMGEGGEGAIGKPIAAFKENMYKVGEGKITVEELRALAHTAATEWHNSITNLSARYSQVADEMEKNGAAAIETSKSIESLTSELEGMKKVAEEARRQDDPNEWNSLVPGLEPEGWGQTPGPPRGFRGGTFDPSSGGDWAGARKSAISGFLSEFSPKESEKAKVRQQFDEMLSLTDNEQTVAQLKAVRDEKLKKIDARGDGGISGQMGAADFASQLTNQLLHNDPQKEMVEFAKKQSGLIERLVGEDNALYKQLAELNKKTFGPFDK